MIIRITMDVKTDLDPGPAFNLALALMEDEFDVRAGSAQRIPMTAEVPEEEKADKPVVDYDLIAKEGRP